MDKTAGSIIQTARLILDPLREEDTATVFVYRSDPAVSQYQGWKPANEAEVDRFIADQRARAFGTPDSWCQLAIRDRETGRLLGDFGIHFPPSLDDPIEFGLSLQPDAQGNGFAREAMEAAIDLAFGPWGYRRLVASVDPRNSASVALCRAVGMRQEGHHVESYLFRGEWVDDVVFALLAREWRK
ncbi:GNAT family protein [Pinirhizobacter sp.]|jgi:RimJ/RimL family protein N-acetyltransferase|uniref:GNAT family N-acetyltransferase n=1 Tax=Pinirhizobacter sp. TaxID=2950432 RepID=UPI002F3FE004